MDIDWDTIDDAPRIDKCLKLTTVQGKIVSVYDGDSGKALLPLNGTLYKWSCRLSGIDTPELRTRYKKEKDLAYKVRDLLREKLMNKVVTLNCGEFDKYGRLLVEIILDDCNINNWLIENNYAFEYKGGRKKSWKEYLSKQDE